jgi:bacterioferritin-associated ferredoxin
MVKVEAPHTVAVNIEDCDYGEISKLCRAAHMNPEQIICYCTKTRAEEVAAAIIKGAKTPEDISRQTGIRTGCKVECIQPILRLLAAAGIEPKRTSGWQWYGKTPTIWDIPQEIKDKYNKRGFYFDEDLKILNKIVDAEGRNRK